RRAAGDHRASRRAWPGRGPGPLERGPRATVGPRTARRVGRSRYRRRRAPPSHRSGACPAPVGGPASRCAARPHAAVVDSVPRLKERHEHDHHRPERAVRPSDAADRDAVAAVLSAAFADDPAFGWIIPDPARRAAVLPGLFALFAEAYQPLGASRIVG